MGEIEGDRGVKEMEGERMMKKNERSKESWKRISDVKKMTVRKKRSVTGETARTDRKMEEGDTQKGTSEKILFPLRKKFHLSSPAILVFPSHHSIKTSHVALETLASRLQQLVLEGASPLSSNTGPLIRAILKLFF